MNIFMKENIKVSVIQMATKWLDKESNANKMAEILKFESKEFGSELIVFPELSNIGYIAPKFDFAVDFAYKYFEAAEYIPGITTEILGEKAKQCNVYVILGIAQLHPIISGGLYNAGVIIGPNGKILGIHHKVHIPFGEKHYFIPGNKVDVYKTELGVLGLSVCYDGRFPEFTRVLSLKGAEIVVSMWARSTAMPKENNEHTAFIRAQENSIYYILCNRAGKEEEKKYSGYSAIAAPDGEIIVMSDKEEEDTIRGILTNDRIIKTRISKNLFRDRRPDLYEEIVKLY